MEKRFRALTDFIPAAEKIIEKRNANGVAVWGKGHVGAHIVDSFVDTFYAWMSEHPEMRLDYYRDILAEHGISTDSMDRADVSKLDAKCVLAMFFASIRANRFSDGFLTGLFQDGTALSWLRALEAADRAE